MGDADVDADQNAAVSAVVEDGGDDYSGAGNRWPRQETLALLKIRSEMDSTFRDSTLKAPLWEHISRKLGELGYKRSAKKCKEKFENVYKYHKRTKDGRRATGKSDKTYRFFEELEAFDQNHHPPPPPPLKPNHQILELNSNYNTNHTVISTTITNNPTILPPPPQPPTKIPTLPPQNNNDHHHHGEGNGDGDGSGDDSSWSTASDEELARPRNNNNDKKKRKRDQWKHFFRRLTRQVIMKQEEMQNKFLEALDRREADLTARREAWHAHHFSSGTLHRSSAASDSSAALISLLQKLSGSADTNHRQTLISNPSSTPTATDAVPISSIPPPRPTRPDNVVVPPLVRGCSPSTPSSSSRWPKSEVEALIELRTTLELKYHENGPKGPLWEEISAGMKRLGYDRSAKRCKEKWENINKYFKKVKDNNKLRPEDSKTCPYFHQLDALYRLKNNNTPLVHAAQNVHVAVDPPKAEEPPLMVQPERQWPMISEEEGDDFDGSDSSSTEVEDHPTNNDDIMLVDMKVQEVVVRE